MRHSYLKLPDEMPLLASRMDHKIKLQQQVYFAFYSLFKFGQDPPPVMNRPSSILLVASDPHDLDTLSQICANLDLKVDAASDSNQALRMFIAARQPVVLLEYRTQPDDAIQLIQRMHAIDPQVRSIIMTASFDAELLDFLAETDSATFLKKPLRSSDLIEKVRVAARKDLGATEHLNAITMSNRMDQCLPLLGSSSKISRVREQIATLAPTRTPVLLEGPFGVGKPDIARFIHYSCGYSERELVLCACEEMDDQEIETRLLSSDGVWGTDVERAKHGTLVVRQIEAIPLAIQRVLTTQFDALTKHCRLVAWANSAMDDLLESGRIDTELYFKLSLHVIHLPALAKRPLDIDKTVRLISAEPEKYGLARAIRGLELDQVVAELRSRQLPGNLRELMQCLRKASQNQEALGQQ